MYDMPTEIDVQADGPLRIITLNRPESLNSVNDALHHGLAKLWQRMSDDQSARAAVITGAGRAFSAVGDGLGAQCRVARQLVQIDEVTAGRKSPSRTGYHRSTSALVVAQPLP